jgi:hypothetical protein
MISSYRLGDLVLLQLTDAEKHELVKEHPHSMGSAYIAASPVGVDNVGIMTDIVLTRMVEYAHLLPRDIAESTVVHLRLGDVVAGKEVHEQRKRPLSIEQLKSRITDNSSKVYVMGACFFAKTSSTNFDECTTSSDAYLRDVLRAFNATHFSSGNADIDLCCGVRAKVFVQGRGYFSRLIVEIRKRLHLDSVETECVTASTSW